MFDDRAFRSWVLILAGALGFASLFASVGLMVELLFEGAFRVTWNVVGLGAAAFIGYIGIGALHRREAASK
jgi:hypothetical protein